MTSYLEKLADLWVLEQKAEVERSAEIRKSTTLEQRVERGIALARLNLQDLRAAPGDRTRLDLSAQTSLDVFRGRTGSPATLWWHAGENRHELDAVVQQKRGDRLRVVVPGSVPEHLLSGGLVNLELDAPLVTFKRGSKAIRQVGEASARTRLGELRDVLLDQREPEYDKYVARIWHDTSLNETQRNAVTKACSARDIALIHGPPGTGKTRTLVEVIQQELARGHRVLVTAASNAAVDNVAERLVEQGVDLVRLGHPARVSDGIEAFTLDALLEARADFKHAMKWMDQARAMFAKVDSKSDRGSMGRGERKETLREARYLMRDARNHLRGVQKAIVSSARVVCATAAGADSQLMDDEDTFDVVILDEATQCADPIALIPLMRGSKLVMAGDPCQLPPTVISPEAQRKGLAKTFFERAAVSRSLLTVQYRMHTQIMQFPSESMYEGRLVADPTVAEHTLADLGVADDWERPGALVFIDTAGKGWNDQVSDDDPSTCNPEQAERTAEEARRLLARGLAPENLAIITPYEAQRRLLRQHLADIDGLSIGTVDAFQGQEKEAVIVDLVRSNADAQIGFLSDIRRMNVALTRARRFLLVVGDSATIGGHSYYASFLEAVESKGAWVSAWA